MVNGSCLTSGELSGSRLTRFDLGGAARAALHTAHHPLCFPWEQGLQSAQLPFSVPCGQGLHSAHLAFRLPCGHGLHSLHWLFCLPGEHRLCPAIIRLRAHLRLRSTRPDVRRPES